MSDITVPASNTSYTGAVTPQQTAAATTPPKVTDLTDEQFHQAVLGSLNDSANTARLNFGLAVQDGAKPDLEGELRQISRAAGVPLDAARSNVDMVRAQAQQQSLDWDRLAAQFPTTASFMADMNNARVAHDDVTGLADVEAATTGSGAPYGFGTAAGQLPLRRRVANFVGQLSPALGSVIAGDATPADSDPQRQAIADSLTNGPLDILTRNLGSAGSLGLIPAGETPNDPGSQIAAGLGQLGGFFAGPLGIGRAAAEGVGKVLPLAVNGGESLLKATAKTAISSAVELGTASGAAASGNALDATSASGAGSTIANAAGTGAALGGSMGVLSRLIPDNTILQAVLRLAGANVLNDTITGARPWDDRPLAQKVLDYGVNSLFSLPGAGRTAGSWLHDAISAELTANDGQQLASLNTAAEASKLRGRDPQAFHDFVTQASENGALRHVYVDGDVLTNALDQAGVGADALAKTMPDVAEQLPLAAQSGGQVQISVPDFATYLAGKDIGAQLLPHLRTDPEGMTVQQANEFRQSAADQFKQQAQQIWNEDELQTAHELSAQQVGDNMLVQLNEANRFPLETNEAYAKLVQSFYDTNAERAGMTPEQLFATYPLRVTAEDVTGANALAQEVGVQARSPSIPGVTSPAERHSTSGEHPTEGVGSGPSAASVAQGERGKLSFADDVSSAPSTITLFKNADLSTFLHESGHHFLNVLDHVSRTGPGPLQSDFKAVTDWFGTTPEKWRSMSIEEKRPLHEQFARGFESYLREGNAPSIEMRGVFQKMRAWLVNVYRNIAQLNVQLSPEVRGVFDRMLASGEEIKLAEASRAYAPMFKTPEEAGMKPEDYAAYQALGHEATLGAVEQLQGRTLRDLKWLEQRKAEALTDVKKDVAEKRAAIEEQTRAAVSAEPVYRARKFMDGEGKGIDLDLVAEKFGFSSGDELAQKLAAAEPLDDVVRAVTDQRMLEQHGDIATPEAMSRAADLAIHNAARTRFIATELKALTKAVGPAQDLARAAKDVAERTIASKRVRDLSPAMFTAAETRAAKMAESARIKGDIEGAAKAKRDQLLNNQLAKAAMDAQADVEADLRYLRRFDTPKKNGAVDPEYRKQIEQLLDQYDLRKSTTLRELGRRKSLAEYVKSQEDSTGITPDIPDYLLRNANTVSYKDMTVEGFRGLVDAVKSLEHTGKLKRELLTAADKRDFDDFVAQAAATIKAHGGKERPVAIEHNQLGDKVRGWGNRFLANHRTLASLLQQMDGADGGFLWDHIVRPMNDAGTREAMMRSESTAALREILKPVINGELRKKVFIPEINNSLSREGMLAIALNQGNEVNRARVRSGDKWSQAQVNAILRHLKPEDWQVVQKVWDHIGSYWPQISAKYERVFGVTPQKVEADPFVTPTGQRLSGGYYPLKYDGERATRAKNNDDAQDLKDMLAGTRLRATTRRGFTEARVDEVNMPVRKDLGVITNHIDEVTHDLAWHEWLLDANRILASGKVEDAIRAHYGSEVLSTMRKTLQYIAGGDVSARTGLSSALTFLRTGTVISHLAWNLKSALAQMAGFGPTVSVIGHAYTLKGAMEYAGSPLQKARQVEALSDFMKIRGQNINRDLREVHKSLDAGAHPVLEATNLQSLAPVSDAVTRSALWAIEGVQRQVDMAAWLGGFRKAQDEGWDHAKAVAYADQVVRGAQGSGMVADMPEVMQGDLGRTFGMFYGAINAQYNAAVKAGRQAGGFAGFVRGAYGAVILPAVLATLVNALIDTARGTQSKDDWPLHLAKDLGWEMFGAGTGLFVGLRELGAIQFGNYSGPSATSAVGDAIKLGGQVTQGQLDAGFWRAMNQFVGGDLLHLPAGQLDKMVEGTAAAANGDAPPTAILLGPPQKG